MEKDNVQIAKRLAELRTFSDYSAAEMADKLGITEQEYVGYEAGADEIPIWLIYKFSALVEMEPQYVLNGRHPEATDANVVYEGKGINIERYPGYSFTSLAPDFVGKQMNPMLVNISPTDTPELVQHGGQEFNYVLEGMLRIIVGSDEYYLRAGDSLYFDPTKPHAQLAMGGAPAKFLTVINEK